MNRRLSPSHESALFRGSVRHRRFHPVAHEFRFPLFMWLLRLDELPSLIDSYWQFGDRRWHWARFRREDYLEPGERPLPDVAIERVAEGLGLGREQVEGEVWLLGQLRYLGCYFSPLNLYFIRRDGEFRHALAEVSNTPWNQTHCYAIDLHKPDPRPKEFHVSPFNPMGQEYHWRIRPPESDKLFVHLQVRDQSSGQATMDASLNLRRLELDQGSLNRVLRRNPSQTASLLAGIYWQALRLYLKGSPFHPHPGGPATAGGHGNRKS